MARVELRHVWKRFGDFVAVEDFSLDAAEGEFIVFVGPSGCGKTTTMRIIAGLEVASDGQVLFDGKDVTDELPHDRDVAMVFQNYALFPHLNVFSNMAFGMRLRKVPKSEIEDRVRKTAQLLGIEGVLQRRPKELSGGQRQRVALGRAIVREPRVFLMDEPLSNLDAALRMEMRAEIIKLQERLAVTTFYVTHDQVEALSMGDRIVVMRDGRIQQIGSPTELYEQPEQRLCRELHRQSADELSRGARRGRPHRPAGGADDARDERRRAAGARPRPAAEVTVGVRPEHIVFSDKPAEAGALSIAGRRRHGRAARPYDARAGEDGVRPTAQRSAGGQGSLPGRPGGSRDLRPRSRLSVRSQERAIPARHQRIGASLRAEGRTSEGTGENNSGAARIRSSHGATRAGRRLRDRLFRELEPRVALRSCRSRRSRRARPSSSGSTASS